MGGNIVAHLMLGTRKVLPKAGCIKLPDCVAEQVEAQDTARVTLVACMLPWTLTQAQIELFGQLLWLSLNGAILLHQPMH